MKQLMICRGAEMPQVATGAGNDRVRSFIDGAIIREASPNRTG